MNSGTGAVGAIRQPLSILCGIALSLLIIAPNIVYTIPLIVNSFFWCYLAVLSGFLGLLLCRMDMSPPLRILPFYLFATCFFSQTPYLSFNAYILIVASFWFFIALRYVDFKTVVTILESAFWLEVILVGMQLVGNDRLLNFDRPGQSVFFGTVMQYMRLSSVFAILAPFLIFKNRWYVIPLLALCVISRSSTFAMSLIVLFGVHLWTTTKNWAERFVLVVTALLAAIGYAFYDWGSFMGAIKPEHGGRLVSWSVIFTTWFTDTAKCSPPPFTGPFNLQWLLFGHGLDSFLPLFPIYKHDLNPFPQAHNCWLQFLWEIGLVGFALIVWDVLRLVLRCYRAGRHDLLAGIGCISVNMFFAFPTRMTQTMLLIIAYRAYCESELT